MRFNVISITILFLLFAFLAGFAVSSGIFEKVLNYNLYEKFPALKTVVCTAASKFEMYKEARRYSAYPDGPGAYKKNINYKNFVIIAFNGIFHTIFEPLFICVFTPQTILNFALLPFFLYGTVRYFSRVPIIILTFIAIATYVGMRNVYVESLIRHRILCDFLYVLIAIAGLRGLITEKSL